MDAAITFAPRLGVLTTCAAFGIALATYYRHRAPVHGPRPRRPSPPRRLGDAERKVVLDMLHEPRFVDLAPAEVFACLLEDGRYLCSVRTMHRILAENAELRERRNQLRHPAYTKPELLATGPNQLWSWDITKLHGPAKWTYFYLYVILDVYSRYVVGWMVAHRESASLAKKLIAETCERECIAAGQLTIHADRGTSMTSKPVAFLLADLGVTKTHSRPHVSDDNPFSEAQFKTLKYRPDFPARFGEVEDARGHCKDFFGWSNHEHHHSAPGIEARVGVSSLSPPPLPVSVVSPPMSVASVRPTSVPLAASMPASMPPLPPPYRAHTIPPPSFVEAVRVGEEPLTSAMWTCPPPSPISVSVSVSMVVPVSSANHDSRFAASSDIFVSAKPSESSVAPVASESVLVRHLRVSDVPTKMVRPVRLLARKGA